MRLLGSPLSRQYGARMKRVCELSMKRAATTHLTCSAPWLLKRQHQPPDAPFTHESFAPPSLLRHSDYRRITILDVSFSHMPQILAIRGESHEHWCTIQPKHLHERLHIFCCSLALDRWTAFQIPSWTTGVCMLFH